ncbi:DEAD/DEAH box helicase family protein, partial [Streptomyces sp. DT20]|uniref:DEAD/DEAH box helicase family protein n=1 Tax=Streptomyces sp. DT20 TaxID=3416519 RepID=UPI003CF5D0DF
MRALVTLAGLERTGRAATADEQEVLASWSGWGAVPQIFDPEPPEFDPKADEATRKAAIRWTALDPARKRLRDLLSDTEWNDARRNTLNAHYTDPALAAAVWEGAQGLGFNGGHVLEPSSGNGIYIGLAPSGTELPVEMTGVEVEGRTAGISRYLYPDANIITAGFENVSFTDPFDAVIGNVPFGRYQRYDRIHNKDLKLSIHDHFILKALALTRPGGITALITSRFTLDAKDPAARERMYDLGDLVGAVRLPAGAHQKTAGTDVVTDLLLLRRRIEGEQPGDSRWLTASEQHLPGHDEPVAVNDYFGAHPQYVLGELRARLGPFGPEPTVMGERDAAPGVSEALAAIATSARSSGLTATPATAASQGESSRARPALATEYLTEGALGLDAQGQPTIVEDGTDVPLDVHPEQRERLVQLIDLKKRTLALYEAEADAEESGETPQLAKMRTALREAYRAFRRTNPPLGKPRQRFTFTPKEARERAERLGLTSVPDEWKARTAFAHIDDDPDASLLFGLEVWDERTGTATEQKVLHERVLEPRRLPETAKTPEDAYVLALEWDGGRLDMSRVASLLGVDEDEAARQIGHLAFRDPAQNGFWEPSHRYLSGNVREKLALARASSADEPAYLANVAALERVQPKDLNPSEIKARCGAPWIPVDDYRAFLTHLGFKDAEVRHAGGTMWEVRGAHVGDLARSEWGTPRRSAQDLMLSILRQADSTIQVTYTDDKGETHVDQPATDAAREKTRLIREAWDDWIWADKERAERLAGIYNATFNALVLPDFANSPLTLPGTSDWKMRPHQNAAIRRIVSEPTALLAHVVGAGKTATMVGGTMELRRTGLASKPAMVIPNHMLRQITREFREIYPNAKLLALSASDLGVKRRAKFMARAAGGDWDAVIMTHEAFNRIPLRPETQLDYIDTEMASLREQLDEASASGMHERTIKQIEADLAAVEARMLKQVDDSANGAGIFLEDTGIDYLMVDEAHSYKNLRTISAIPGAGIQGSIKATKLHMVLGHLRKINGSGRVCTLATGTPIANSVTEAYVLKRYLAPDLLDQQGLTNFDSWAATFGEVVSALEPDAKGDGYKYKARFARFFNVPELMTAYRSFADVQNAEDLGLPVPTVLKGPDGQRGESISFPVTGSQRAFIKALPSQSWVKAPGGVLKALGLGLRASLDMRLVGEQDEEAGSKLPYAAEQIAEVWRDTKDVIYPTSNDDPTPQKLPGGLQLVFLDEGTPGSSADNPVDLYDSLREHLVEQGLPREEIRFIHEASSDRKKDKLFADCRAGRVSVLIGSTEKMGTGTNIQDRSVALHHLSYPWRPADMAQRDGRLERQGNLNAPWIEGTPDHVRILYYVTAGSFDEFRLTTLARKAKFISQIQRKDFSLREIEDIGEDAVNLSMLSALASGDPAILQLAEATADRARMQGLARTWDGQQDDRAQTVKYLDDYLQRAAASLSAMREAAPNRRRTAGDAFALTIDGRTLKGRDTAAKSLGARMVAIARDQSLGLGARVPIGMLGGFPFHGEIAYDHSGHRQLKLRFPWGNTVPVGHRDDRAQWQATSVTESSGRGAIIGLENFLNKLEDDSDKLEREITIQQGHRQDAADNLRPYEDNPYRIQARSKEREERLLSQLVIINEKKATLTETVDTAGESALDHDVEELEKLTAKAAELRSGLADEHAIQEQATHLNVAPTAVHEEQPLAETDSAEPLVTQTQAPHRGEIASQTTARDAASTPEAAESSVAMTYPSPPESGGLGTGPTSPEPDRAQGAEISPAPALAQEPEPVAQLTPDSTPTEAPDGDAWENAVRELAAAGLLDEQVTAWARSNDVDGLALPLEAWVGRHLADRWEDLDNEEWPDWVTKYFSVSAQTRKHVVEQAAKAIHTAVHKPSAEPNQKQPSRSGSPDGTRPDAGQQTNAPFVESAAPKQEPASREPYLGSWMNEVFNEAEGMAIELFASAAMADDLVTRWARESELESFAAQFTEWSETWITELLGDDEADELPMPIRFLAHRASMQSAKRIMDGAAAMVHDIARRPPTPADGQSPVTDHREQPAEPGPAMSDEPAVTDEPTEPVDPQVEAILQVWLQSPDWRVKTVAEARTGQRIHLTGAPGYVLVERTSGKADRWEVVPASTGQQIKFAQYSGIASWDTREREPAENFASKLEQALRAKDGTPFAWPPPRRWRSADGRQLDRAVAEVRAACDRELGMENSPGIHLAQTLADRDAKAEAAAEEKKAAAKSKRAAAKAGKPTAGTEGTSSSADQDSHISSEPSDTAPAGSGGSEANIPDNDARLPQPEQRQEASEGHQEESTPPLSAGGEPIVITPEGPGRLLSLQGGLALVAGGPGGTKVWQRTEIHHPGQPDAPLTDPAELGKRRQNEADAAQASTSAGIHLRHASSRRLRDLDMVAGHGTVVEHAVVDWDGNVHDPGEVVGWVRARMGDDGKRYWWGQDAEGGPPDSMPFHENLPAKAGLPAIRAAGRVRHDMPGNNIYRAPLTAPYAAREITLTSAQVAQLRALPLTGTYPDGSELPTPEWVGGHRRYVMSVAQMQALRLAAESAADTCDTTTTTGRRSRKVLLNAAAKLHFEEYETGRRRATIPAIGEPDPYAEPYSPPPPRPEPAPTEPAQPLPTAATPEAVHDQEQQAPPLADPAPVAEPHTATGTAARSDTNRPVFAPQDRVFYNAMRYVVESVSPDGASIHTVSGHDVPAAAAVPEAEMPPVTTEDLADGWWRFTYEGRAYTAALLPPELRRTHPTAMLSVVIVNQEGQLVGRAFGRPHESVLIWADSHPGVPHPHIAEWLGDTPWPDYTNSEAAHITAGPPPDPDARPEQTDDPPTEAKQPVAPPKSLETPTIAPPPNEPQSTAGSEGPGIESDSVNVPASEEYDMTDTSSSARDTPDVEEPPEPERYSESTPLTDPDYVLRLYGWDGQPADSGEVYYLDTVISAVRPSAGGGWFARLSGGDVTALTATSAQAAHQAAIYFSALTETPYGAPIPDAQPDEKTSRADLVRTAVRDAASTHHDRIATGAARTWPSTYESHPQLQSLLDRLGDMQYAVSDGAGARQMEADMDAVTESASAFIRSLPNDPTTPERQNLGFPVGFLLYDVRRLQDHLQAAAAAALAERAIRNQEQTVPEPRRTSETMALPHDLRYQLHLSGAEGQDHDSATLTLDGSEVADIRRTAAGRWYGRLAASDVTTTSTTPHEAAHKAAILRSVLSGDPYGEPATAAQDTATATRVEILRQEMGTLASHHRLTVNNASQLTWPDGGGHTHFLKRLNDQLDIVSAAATGDPTANQMHDQLSDTRWLANDWLHHAKSQADSERVRQAMGYTLAAVVYDINRLLQRLEATAAAVQAERTAQQAADAVNAADEDRVAHAEQGVEPEMAAEPSAAGLGGWDPLEPADQLLPSVPGSDQQLDMPDEALVAPPVTGDLDGLLQAGPASEPDEDRVADAEQGVEPEMAAEPSAAGLGGWDPLE